MKILVVLPRFPYPLEKGDKLRAYYQIKELSKHNEVYLFCVTHTKVLPEHIEQLKPFCRGIKVVHSPRLVNYKNVVRNYINTKSLQIGYWDSLKARRNYKKFERQVMPDVIYSQMVRTMPLVSRSVVPKVMDFQDALSMNTERRMDTAHGLWRYILHFEFKMLRSTEYNAFKIFDGLTIISENDSEAIPHRKNGDIHIIPNGVDFDYFKPMEHEKKYDIVFCGNMRYEPNVHASNYLVKRVMPLVWEEFPKATLLLAGAYPKHKVSQLANDRVTVTGFVDDIRECYASARIFAAPMQTGSGLQNKLLEAMAMGLPCVTTSIANDSLQATLDTEILVGDTAQEFATHIINLLRNDEQRNELAANGTVFVHKNYSWETAGEKLEEVLRGVVMSGSSKVSTEKYTRKGE
ncbi:MAG: glycosyltransferase [Bacteroidales bacterium]|nr:glycosyltransferase [Bacteroidales bacterium]